MKMCLKSKRNNNKHFKCKFLKNRKVRVGNLGFLTFLTFLTFMNFLHLC